MHPIQKKILELAQTRDIRSMGLREIGREIGELHPQKIKFHLQKLNLLTKEKAPSRPKSEIVSIPLFGLANCGEAVVFADQQYNQPLQVSKKALPSSHGIDHLFAVQAVGSSMNRANIKNKNIEDGDYVLIDSEEKNFKEGDYVLSIMNGMANIKRFSKNELDHQIVLTSESSKDIPPIFIHEEDFDSYFANGKVVDVFKSPYRTAEDFVFEPA